MRKDKEIYHLPLVVSKQDMEVEKFYVKFYNDEYWEKYDEKKNKELEKTIKKWS